MNAEGYLKKFCHFEYMESGFSSEKEFEQEIFSSLDYCLVLLCNKKEHTVKTTVQNDSIKILLANFNEEKSITFSEIESALSKLDSYMSNRFQRSSDNIKKSRLAFLLCSFCNNTLDRIMLLLALSGFYDCKYEYVYSWLSEDITVKLPTVEIAHDIASMFGVKIANEQVSNQIKNILIFDRKKGSSLFDETITIDSRVISYIKGSNQPFDIKKDYVQLIPCVKPKESFVIRESIYSKIKRLVEDRIRLSQNTNQEIDMLHIYGSSGMGKHLILQYLAFELQKPVLCVDLRKIYGGNENEIEKILNELSLECLLTGAMICFKDYEALEEDDVTSEIKKGNLIYLTKRILKKFDFSIWTTREAPAYLEEISFAYVRYELGRLTATERIKLWKYFCQFYHLSSKVDYVLYANQYIHSPGQIKSVLETAESLRRAEKVDCIQEQHILSAIKTHTPAQLGKYAGRINAVFQWDDLILDEMQKKQLRQICNQVKYRSIVGEEWGFYGKTPYGRGICAMFYGSPGTGKTMAAQVIANELGMELYRIDLSQMVSKYIGETEKNITELFNKAKNINALLFFDEADSLFAKRSEVSDANDRYANANTAHLLQKLEDFEGITILATNHYANIDDAFKRRIKFMVNFSQPQFKERYQLWTSILTKATPLEEDIDFEFFAKEFELTGSSIKEIITNAVYLAAAEHTGLANRHIVKAVILNYGKYGKILSKDDFGYLGVD